MHNLPLLFKGNNIPTESECFERIRYLQKLVSEFPVISPETANQI